MSEIHVVMLPWLAFGHMIPFLELSIAFAKSQIHVSFLTTPRNIPRLPKIPPNLSKFIHFVSFPLPNPGADPLPENAEATVDIPADKMDSLKIAYDLLRFPIKNFIAEKRPNWIIVDFCPHWAADIAQDFSIPLIRFCVTAACTAALFTLPEFLIGDRRRTPQHLTTPSDWVDLPSKVAFRNHEATTMHNSLCVANASGISDVARVVKLMQASRAVVIRTCPELEADYLKQIEKVIGKPVLPVGLLPPEITEQKSRSHQPWAEMFNWLDQRTARSVVFVGFGSENKLSKEQIHEIAYGLELSGLPFVWALRKPDKSGDGDTDDVLPPGFCRRTAAQGVVQIGWAPQREILGHPSVGGSFFHAGWGSIIEAMIFGHVLVFLPFVIDQPLNARLMGERELGIEVERAEDGSFTRHSVADALREAMLSHRFRPRAQTAAGEIFGDRHLQWSYVQNLVHYLKNGSA